MTKPQALPAFEVATQRALQLDALAAVLPMDRRDLLAEILSDNDVATLRHLVQQGIGENTLRALASDLAYLEAWCRAATDTALPWPAPEALLIKFVAHHLWDSLRRETDPNHGMPDNVSQSLRKQGFLRKNGPHAPATVRRRLANWSTLTRWRGLEGVFGAPTLRSALRLAVRASPRQRQRKSVRAVTADVLLALLKSCGEHRLVDLRDRALLLVAFASGGRRRSEVARLRLEQFLPQDPVPLDPSDPEAGTLPCLAIQLGRTKTSADDDGESVLLIGRPVEALQTWIAAANISAGPVFRAIDRWSNLESRALSPQAVNLILKARISSAGLDPKMFSAHGLRSGYLTEAANRGIPLTEAMEQSRHRSVQQASSYYNDADRKRSRAARIII
jgi:integrase